MRRFGGSVVIGVFVLCVSAPASAQLLASSIEVGGAVGLAPQNLTSGGGFGATFQGRFTNTWGKWMLRLSGAMYTPRASADNYTSYTVSARIGRWSRRKVGRHGDITIKGGVGVVSEKVHLGNGWVMYKPKKDYAGNIRTVAAPDTVIPAGWVLDTRTWSLIYRQVINGKRKEDGMEVRDVNGSAAGITWTRVGSLGEKLGLMLDAEAYVYLAGDDAIRFLPGAAIRSHIVMNRLYCGPTLRIDLFTGIAFTIDIGVTLNLAGSL